MSDLMQKLAMSNAKTLMGQTDSPKRMDSSRQSMVQEFEVPNIKYNIPQEYLQENPQQSSQPYLSSLPVENTKPVGVPTVDAIKNSKLPDEIKKLMMEHPIGQPAQQQTMTMSNELIEKSRRLMGNSDAGYLPESARPKTVPQQSQPQSQPSNTGIDYKLIQKMINEAVTKSLRENGLIAESSEKSNEVFSFKVGKHIFEGKVTKIKKLA
jgi:hypothetical protein